MNEGDLSTVGEPIADLSCLLIGKHCVGVMTNGGNLPNGRGFVTMEMSPILGGGKRLNLGVFQMYV